MKLHLTEVDEVLPPTPLLNPGTQANTPDAFARLEDAYLQGYAAHPALSDDRAQLLLWSRTVPPKSASTLQYPYYTPALVEVALQRDQACKGILFHRAAAPAYPPQLSHKATFVTATDDTLANATIGSVEVPVSNLLQTPIQPAPSSMLTGSAVATETHLNYSAFVAGLPPPIPAPSFDLGIGGADDSIVTARPVANDLQDETLRAQAPEFEEYLTR